MLLPDNTWVLVLLSVALILGLTSTAMAYACLCRLRTQGDLTRKLYRQLEANLKLVNSSTIGMGKRIVALEHGHSSSGASKGSDPEARDTLQAVPADSNVNDAIMLLSAGLAPEEVARRCGISRAEASLMKLMQSQGSPASAA